LYFTSKPMGIDPVYGSSAFGIVVTQRMITVHT